MVSGQLHVIFQGVQLRCEAAVDTGNQALDALTGLPLVVLPFECAKRSFVALGQVELPEGMRLTGVRTVSGAALLPCFLPDLLVFQGKTCQAVVAIAPKGMLRVALVPSVFGLVGREDPAGRRSL